MFGVLSPGLCKLKPEGRDIYRQAYCGMCKSMGQQFGAPYRIMVNNDLVVYALLVEAFAPAQAEPAKCRCPIAPWLQRPILSPDRPAMVAVAALQILFARGWLEDKAEEGKPFMGKLARALPAERAESLARALDLDINAFQGLTERQARLEQENTSLEAVMEPTATLMGRICQSIPRDRAADAQTHEQLMRIGEGLGQAIYLIDAFKDLPADLKRGHFNPLCTGAGKEREPCPIRMAQGQESLNRALARIATAIELLPLLRHKPLLAHILTQNLPAKANKTVAKCYGSFNLQAQATHFIPVSCSVNPQGTLNLYSMGNGGSDETNAGDEEERHRKDCTGYNCMADCCSPCNPCCIDFGGGESCECGSCGCDSCGDCCGCDCSC